MVTGPSPNDNQSSHTVAQTERTASSPSWAGCLKDLLIPSAVVIVSIIGWAITKEKNDADLKLAALNAEIAKQNASTAQSTLEATRIKNNADIQIAEQTTKLAQETLEATRTKDKADIETAKQNASTAQSTLDATRVKNRADVEIASKNLAATDKKIIADVALQRAAVVKDLLPVVADPHVDVTTRAYTLRSAFLSGAVDAEATVELARSLLPDGLDDAPFKRVMASTMPDGIPAICRQAYALKLQWESKFGGTFAPSANYNPESGRENVSQEMARALREARLWRSIVLEAAPQIPATFSALTDSHQISQLLPGLYLLLDPGSEPEAVDLSKCSSRGIKLVGLLSRIMMDSYDKDASLMLSQQILFEPRTRVGMRFVESIYSILRSDPPSGPIADAVAEIATAKPLAPGATYAEQEAFYWLRFHSAELLLAMEIHAKTTKLNGARGAEGRVAKYLTDFGSKLSHVGTELERRRLQHDYDNGTVLRAIIDVASSWHSDQITTALTAILRNDEEKLRMFPFLSEAIQRAISAHN